MARKLLTEKLDGNASQIAIVEEAPKEPGILARVQGIFSECDVENKNGRIYERGLWEATIGSQRIQEGIKSRTLFGEPDHPQDRTESTIQGASHFITSMSMTEAEDNKVRGEIALLNVPKGRLVHEMLKAEVKLGFSTRGDGDLIEADDKDDDALKVDPESYEFYGTDFVLNPSFISAGAEGISESSQKAIRTALTEAVEEGKMTDEQVKTTNALLEAVSKTEKTPLKEDEQTEEIKCPKCGEILSGPGKGGKCPVCGTTLPVEATEDDTEQKDKEETSPEDEKEDKEEEVEKEEETVVISPNSMKGLDAVLKELRTAHEELSEAIETAEAADEETARLLSVRADLDSKIAAFEKRIKELKIQFAERNQVAEARTKEVKQLKQMLHEQQDAHNAFVDKIKEVFKDKVDAETKLDTSKQMIEELTKRNRKLQEEHKKELLKLKRQNASKLLDTVKRIKSEGVDFSESCRTLFEKARSEEEVDAVLETLQESQSHRYSDLPIVPHSRDERQEIMNQLEKDGLLNESTQKTEEETEDQRETAKVFEGQIVKERKKK